MPSRTRKQKKMMAALSHGWKPKKDRKKLPSNKVALDFHVKDYPSHLKKAFDVAWVVLKEDEFDAQKRIYAEREEAAKKRAEDMILQRLLQKPCPQCGAGIGVPCTNPSRGHLTHIARYS